MKRRKLKGYVLPTTYLLTTIAVFTGILFMGSSLNNEDNYDYSTGVIKETSKPVIGEDETDTNVNFTSPVDNESVAIGVYYYDSNADAKRQEESLIYYENTYLPNTGVLYTSDNSFEVKSVATGKVVKVEEDEIMGSYVVVEHNTNLKTYYYGLNDIEVKAGDEVTASTILGVSKENNVALEKKSCLFEVYYKGEVINPEKLINAKYSDFE